MIYLLNEELFPPEQYLCDNVERVQLEDGQVVLSTNCFDNLKRAIYNVNNSI